ncbi:MAG: STAS domain-containing protein [Spirochaetes bacterium]|nr:STAS domain-containing protein [Spirochaetota bacterium]
MMEIRRIDEQFKRIYIMKDDIDSSSITQFEKELLDFCADGEKDVVIDVSGVARIDSLVLALFLKAKNLLSSKGRKFYLANPSDSVKKIIEIASLEKLLCGECDK